MTGQLPTLLAPLKLTPKASTHAHARWAVLNDVNDGTLACPGRVPWPRNGDLARVCCLVNLDAGVKLLLEALDGLPTLANDTPHDILGALNGLGGADSVLRGTRHMQLRPSVCIQVLKRWLYALQQNATYVVLPRGRLFGSSSFKHPPIPRPSE